ncbi:Molybdenum cofactor cytidylyltransferase [hydrothermal vent metagenome]|uniref:Molybdenum cofactor cytidylyltransferase n=1 Tax=hydrothermal vent metagenome TaxID=652676 RepID=A0A3B0VJD7_9ZZZZ
MRINGLILAAGNSSRLGQPKQLIKYQGRTLLADIEAKLLSCCDQVFVVLGYRPELFSKELSGAEIINNPNWQAGMGSSMTCGVQVAGQQSDGLLIALSDQPLIDLQHFQKLVDQFTQTPDQIVTTAYQNQCGVPVIFPSRYMNQLTQLDAKTGAQSVIHKYPNQIKKIECAAAAYDVDTVNDLFE